MKYKVAGIVFDVILEAPYAEMEYSPVVRERIRIAASGGIGLDVKPTRAGDSIPNRTLIQSREEVISGGLDLSQYAPFRTGDADGGPAFSLTVRKGMNGAPKPGKLILAVHGQPPCYSIFQSEEGIQYTLDEDTATGRCSAILAMSIDASEGTVYIDEGISAYGAVNQISTALMMMFTYNAAPRHLLLVHASVVSLGGKANLFLGESGTGKSTHSRLWTEHIQGAELLNDDNPILGFDAAGRLIVYGSPWSGKTPCYRNVCAPVNAIVLLRQGAENKISQMQGIAAYAALLGSVSVIRWEDKLMDCISDSVEKAVYAAKILRLQCLPDKAAAVLCKDASFR